MQSPATIYINPTVDLVFFDIAVENFMCEDIVKAFGAINPPKACINVAKAFEAYYERVQEDAEDNVASDQQDTRAMVVVELWDLIKTMKLTDFILVPRARREPAEGWTWGDEGLACLWRNFPI